MSDATMTTDELGRLLAHNIKHGHGHTKLGATALGFGTAYHQCMPIALERDALKAERDDHGPNGRNVTNAQHAALRAEVERLRQMLRVPPGVAPHRGGKTYRLRDNPAEKVLSDEWHSENTREGVGCGMLPWLMGDGSSPGATTARDEYVAATVIQWLGTPVGHNFLEKCGFVLGFSVLAAVL